MHVNVDSTLLMKVEPGLFVRKKAVNTVIAGPFRQGLQAVERLNARATAAQVRVVLALDTLKEVLRFAVSLGSQRNTCVEVLLLELKRLQS